MTHELLLPVENAARFFDGHMYATVTVKADMQALTVVSCEPRMMHARIDGDRYVVPLVSMGSAIARDFTPACGAYVSAIAQPSE